MGGEGKKGGRQVGREAGREGERCGYVDGWRRGGGGRSGDREIDILPQCCYIQGIQLLILTYLEL